MLIKRRLVIDVTYDVSECSQDDIRELDRNLDHIANNASGNGLFTNHTPATVDTWVHVVVDADNDKIVA